MYLAIIELLHICIFGKVLDKTLLNTQRNTFNTGDIQFGFKQNSSTVICSMVIETIIVTIQCIFC